MQNLCIVNVAVNTPALHAESPGFEPQRNLLSYCALWLYLFVFTQCIQNVFLCVHVGSNIQSNGQCDNKQNSKTTYSLCVADALMLQCVLGN